MAVELYPFQKKFISDIYGQFNAGHKSVLAIAACGAGKSVVAAFMIRDAYKKGRRVWFAVHLDALIDQTYDSFVNTFRSLGDDGVPVSQIGVIHPAYKKHYDRPVQVVAIATAANRLKQGKVKAQYYPSLYIADEAHTSSFSAADQTIRDIANPALKIGLTATPVRLSPYETFQGKFTGMAQSLSRAELVELGKLAPLRFLAPNGNLAVGTKESEVKTAYDTPEAIKHCLDLYERLGEGGKCIAFCVDVEHAQHVADESNKRSIVAETINYKTPRGKRTDIWPRDKTRSAIIRAFEEGRIQMLTGKDVLAVGFDVKDTVVGLMLRPTESWALHDQQIGRAGRSAPGKEYGIILDAAGNCDKHGYCDHVWTYEEVFVDPRDRDAAAENPFAIPCVECEQLISANSKFCKHCGAEQPEREGSETISRSFGSPLIEVVRPSTLDPTNKQHAIKYFRYLLARAVLKNGSLPGSGYFQFKENADFSHWVTAIPRGSSEWTLGAIFGESNNLAKAKDYYKFLKLKYDSKPELTDQQRQFKVWYSLGQEFDDLTVATLRAELSKPGVRVLPFVAPEKKERKKRPEKVVVPAWG